MICHKPNCTAIPYVITKERKDSPGVVWCEDHWMASAPSDCYYSASFLGIKASWPALRNAITVTTVAPATRCDIWGPDFRMIDTESK